MSLDWSHTRMYAPGTRAMPALPGTKNPALSTLQEISLLDFRPPLVPNFTRFVQVGLRFRRSVLVHMSRKLRSSWTKLVKFGGSGWI